MLMDALDALRESGVTVEVRQGLHAANREVDAVLDVAVDGVGKGIFAAETKGRAPYPNELGRLDARRQQLLASGQPLLVVPFVSEPLAARLVAAGWSWVDAEGNFDLRAPGLLLRQRKAASASKVRRRTLPQGSGALGVIRSLIRFDRHAAEEPSATGLARQAQVSQPRASQVLAQLRDLGLVKRTAERRWIPNRELLLDRFLAEYPGPGGSQRFCYSLDPLVEVAARAAALGTDEQPIVVSADVGADIFAPWRRPEVLILYSERDLKADELGAVGASGRHDANVIVRLPADRSVFRDTALSSTDLGPEIRIVDEAQLIWDLQDLGGADRLEQAGEVRRWLIDRL